MEHTPPMRVTRWTPGSVCVADLEAVRAMRARAYAGMGTERDAEEVEARRVTAHRRWVEGIDAPPGALMHVVQADGRSVAVGNTFVRTIHADGGPMEVLALAGVASDPAARGRGFGRAVVLDAFRRVDEGEVSVSLFQTGKARDFYEKLGCVLVENGFVDNTADPPNPAPWNDDFVMRYPADAPWPAGTLDLNGPGY